MSKITQGANKKKICLYSRRHRTYIRRSENVLDVLCTFNLLPLFTGVEFSNYPKNLNIYLYHNYKLETTIFVATEHEKTIMTVI